MTEDEARQVLLLQAHEAGGATPLWSAEDRAWATRQAVATLGEQATPERFVATRAVLALQRLLPRDRSAQRWLGRRGWHAAWVLLVLVLGLVAGLAVDQLGPPQRVNLLAPAVWAVVGWNLLVYAALLLPLPRLGLKRWLAGWGQHGDDGPTLLWARHAAPLTTARAALVLHVAAAALAAGLIGGLYLRGLVLDYRAGWQSTFLDAPQVQALLRTLLAPAAALTGLAVPDVAPLRVGPDAPATASAALWIHLFAATLAVFVVLPRTLLAWRAAWAARRLARRFPLALDTPYFEALHPLMRPGLPRAVRLLWAAPADCQLALFDTPVAAPVQPLTLLRSDEGDELQLDPLPPDLGAAAPPAGWWQRLLGSGDSPEQRLLRLRERCDAVLLVTAPDTPRPPWLATLARPVVVLLDAPAAAPPAVPLQRRADGWLPEGRLLQALQAALDGDPRLLRLADSWTRRAQAAFDADLATLAATLARIAAMRAPVADEGFLARRSEAEAARATLAAMLDTELQAAGAAPALAAALHGKVGEGRAALVGGVVTGALAGLKADLLSGGLTMGGGTLIGAALGALGGAGVARGLNVVRGTDRSYAAWDAEAMAAITETLLLRRLVQAHGLPEALARDALATALPPQQRTLATLWNGRSPRDGDAAGTALAAALQPPLGAVLKAALQQAGGSHNPPP